VDICKASAEKTELFGSRRRWPGRKTGIKLVCYICKFEKINITGVLLSPELKCVERGEKRIEEFLLCIFFTTKPLTGLECEMKPCIFLP